MTWDSGKKTPSNIASGLGAEQSQYADVTGARHSGRREAANPESMNTDHY
jgi:hypothetical protein